MYAMGAVMEVLCKERGNGGVSHWHYHTLHPRAGQPRNPEQTDTSAVV